MIFGENYRIRSGKYFYVYGIPQMPPRLHYLYYCEEELCYGIIEVCLTIIFTRYNYDREQVGLSRATLEFQVYVLNI